MTNDEIPKPKRMTNPECRSPKPRADSSFGLRHSFVIRHSSFVISLWLALLPACSVLPTSAHRAEAEFEALQKLELDYRALVAEDEQIMVSGETPEAQAARKRIKARVDDLLARYRDFLQKHPNNAEAHDLLALLCYENARSEEALAHWEAALKINPNFANAHNGLGQFYSHTGEPLRAIAHFQKAIELEPKRAVFHYNLGLMYSTSRYEAMQQYGWDLPRTFAECQKEFRLARDLEPTDFEYAKNVAENYFLAKYFLIENPWDEAIQEWQHCLKIAPDDAAKSYALTCLGRAYLRKGQKPEAKAVLTQALTLNPHSPAQHLLKKCE